MVDIHAHILPGIDDGAASLDEAVEMCRAAFEDGVRTIVATPHIGKFPNTKETILSKAGELKNKIGLEGIGINLLTGADVEFGPDIFRLVEEKKAFTINNSRYLLLDIPYYLLPPNVVRHIGHLVELGVVPVIGHPERCLQIQENTSIVYDLVKAGAIMQATASSITGLMGPKAKEAVFYMLKQGLAHIIATDTHGLKKRPPLLSEAVSVVSGIIGKDMALAMVTTIPQSIIDNKPISISEPKKQV